MTELGLGGGPADASLWKVNYEYGELSQDGNSVDPAKNTGNIARQTLTMPGTSFVQSYRYDSLYRLTEAVEKTGTTQNWIQNWSYDRYGNRLTFTQNIAENSNAVNPTVDPNTNRFTSTDFGYDRNGNVVRDIDPLTSLSRTFVFNGDNKQTDVKDANGATIGRYFYDGEGKRIKKIVGDETTVFVYSAGTLVAEYSTELPTDPSVNYTTTDHLGSPRIITDQLGQVRSRRDFLPFGEEIDPSVGGRSSPGLQYSGPGDSVRQKFTGYQKDNETSLDFAEARMYENRYGRFTAVDPLLASGKSANPQTSNRYIYVGNNPMAVTDPHGLEWYRRSTGNQDRPFQYKWFNDDPGEGWSAVDFGSMSNIHRRVDNAFSGDTPLGTIYLSRYSNSYLNQSEYNDFRNRGLYLGCAGLTNVCVINPAATFDQIRGWKTGSWNFLAATVNSPIELPVFNTVGGSFSARQMFDLPLVLDYAEYQNKAEAQSAFQTQVVLTAASFAAGGAANAARASRFASIAPEAINGAQLEFLAPRQIARIQSFANKRNVEITLFGSRARGNAHALSDWDYLIDANYKIRKEAKWMLPKGPANGGRNRIDVIKPSNFLFDISNQPQIIFRPQ